MEKKESTQSARGDRGNRWLEKWIFEEFLRQRSQAESQTAGGEDADDYGALHAETTRTDGIQDNAFGGVGHP